MKDLSEQIEALAKDPKIVIGPDPILKKKCEPIDWIPELYRLSEIMRDLMKKNNGIGLAASQVGIPIKFLVAEVDDLFICLVNPEILEYSAETDTEKEGCLSYPGIQVLITRSTEIKVQGILPVNSKELVRTSTVNYVGRVKGLMARVLQHEIEHTLGISHISYLTRSQRRQALTKLKKKKKNNGKRQL